MPPEIRHSVCPHDCPSTCALDVEKLDEFTIGRIRGARDNSYTAGTICAKVARYAERLHHPGRLLQPLQRTGPKGSGEFRTISWQAALDEVGNAFLRAEQRHGAEAVWPYYTVRRHINWNNHRPDLKEDLAHLVQDIKRRICGIASAGSPSFSV